MADENASAPRSLDLDSLKSALLDAGQPWEMGVTHRLRRLTSGSGKYDLGYRPDQSWKGPRSPRRPRRFRRVPRVSAPLRLRHAQRRRDQLRHATKGPGRVWILRGVWRGWGDGSGFRYSRRTTRM
jgi:hypothetical protein